MFELDKNLNISAKGIIPDNLSVRDECYKEWLDKVIGKFQEISNFYRHSISGDGRLIGIEKNEMQVKLESFFLLNLSFLQKFKKESSDIFFSSYKEKDIYIQFATSSLWHISGSIAKVQLTETTHFGDWFNHRFSIALKNFVEEFGKDQLDGILTLQEKEKIFLKLSKLLLEVILMLIALEHLDITK